MTSLTKGDAPATGEPGPPDAALRVVPVRHPGRWVATLVVAVLLAMLVRSLATNDAFQWSVVGDNLTTPVTLRGLVLTLELTAIAMAMGIVIGIVLAVMRLSTNPLVATAAWLYVWFFRGTPVLVQIIFWFNIGILFPKVGLGIPFGPQFVSGTANDLVTAFTAAILALGLNEGAYMSEIVRAGILSVDQGQSEAAHALGMTRLKTLRRVVLPQAMRIIIPPTGNETISMLKTTSLVSVISLGELLYSVQSVYSRTFQPIPLLIVASIWYLVATTVLTIGQFFVERHYGRGTATLGLTPWQRIRMLTRSHQAPAMMPSTVQRPPDGMSL